MFTTLDPHTFLYTRKKLQIKGYETQPPWLETVQLSISPFGQSANYGKNIYGQDVELSAIDNGALGLLPLLFGQTPAGQTLPPLLQNAQLQMFPNGLGLNDPDLIDRNQLFGFISIPLQYRKRGLRFEFDAMLVSDVGISLQTGFADIMQTMSTQGQPAIIDLTPSITFQGNSFCNVPITQCNVDKYLTSEFLDITEQICLEVENFHRASIEEVRLNLFWRHAFAINENEDEWPEFLLLPFFQLTGSISPGIAKSPYSLFSLPFGNNRHGAIGFNTGLNFDFYDTIEIGAEVGYTHFFKRNCVAARIPNSDTQSGIYPFITNVNYQPGDNWNFCAKIAAYHFLDRLSTYFQFVFVTHLRDSIKLVNCDPAFVPDALEDITDWRSGMGNWGFNYDVSPNIGLGLLWQMPLYQRRAYVSSTLMFSANFTF